MARKNIEKVIAAFLEGKEAVGDSKRTCCSDGNAIYSYSTCIAAVEPHIAIVFNKTKYSATTSQQQRAVEVALLKKFGSASIVYVDDVPKGCSANELLRKAIKYPEVHAMTQPKRGLRKGDKVRVTCACHGALGVGEVLDSAPFNDGKAHRVAFGNRTDMWFGRNLLRALPRPKAQSKTTKARKK